MSVYLIWYIPFLSPILAKPSEYRPLLFGIYDSKKSAKEGLKEFRTENKICFKVWVEEKEVQK